MLQLQLSILLLHRHHYAACWLVLIGYLLDLADGAVARQLNACSALGKWTVPLGLVRSRIKSQPEAEISFPLLLSKCWIFSHLPHLPCLL